MDYVRPLTRCPVYAAVRSAVAAPSKAFAPFNAPGLQLWLDPSIAPASLLTRRNLFDQSSVFTDNTWWLKFQVTVTAAPTIAPPRSAPWATPHKIAALGGPPVIHSNWDNFESGERRAWSIYVKKGDPEFPVAWISLDSFDLAASVVDRYIELHIDLNTGEVRTPFDYVYDVDINGEDFENLPRVPDIYKSLKAEDVGDGWWRLRIGMISDIRAERWQYAVGFTAGFDSGDFTEGKGGYIAAAQFEESLYNTTYQNIITYDATDKQRILLNEALLDLVLFQDAAGQTPVDTVEQPVGLFLDKSQGLARGADMVLNGDFSNGVTSWTAIGTGGSSTVVNGELEITGGSGNTPGRRQVLTTVVGACYEITCTARQGTTVQTVAVSFGAGGQLSYTTTGNVTKSMRVIATATSTNLDLTISNATAVGTAYFDNITVRRISGNHGNQTTGGARPIYCARRNQLTKSEQLDDATWGKTGCTITANSLDTLDKIAEDTSTGSHRITSGGLTAYAGMAFVSSFRVKAAERTRCQITFSNTTPWSGGVAPTADFNLSTGAVISSSGCTASVVNLGDGTYRIIVAVLPVGTGSFSTRLQLHNGTSTSYTGVAGNGILAGEAQTELGTAFTKYQWIDTATVYDTDLAFPRYLRFDSAAHYLNFVLAAMSACTIISGFMVETAPAFTVYGFNNINTSTNVGFGHAEDSATTAARAVSGTGSALEVAAATDVAILPHVVTVSTNGTTIRARVNNGTAVSAASATSFAGTSWRLGRTLNDIGSMTGRCYQVLLYNAVLEAALEDLGGRYVGTKMGLSL